MKATVLVSSILTVSILLNGPVLAGGPHRTRATRRQGTPPLSAAHLTGTYKQGEYGTIDVLALPGGRVRFHFDGLAHLNAPGGPNIGDAGGILPLNHNMGVYTAAEGGGRMILRFAPRRVYVSQAGALGFGAGVVAAGVYKKTSSRVPKFDLEND